MTSSRNERGGRDGMRTSSSDSFPIVLALAAFVLMFLGQSTYERLLAALIVAIGRYGNWCRPRSGNIIRSTTRRP